MKFSHFTFVCHPLNQSRNVYIYLLVDVASDPSFHVVKAMLLPEDCVNLARFIVEAEKLTKILNLGIYTWKFVNLPDAEKDHNL